MPAACKQEVRPSSSKSVRALQLSQSHERKLQQQGSAHKKFQGHLYLANVVSDCIKGCHYICNSSAAHSVNASDVMWLQV